MASHLPALEQPGTTTIVGLDYEPLPPMQSLNIDQLERTGVHDVPSERKQFKIRLADTYGQRAAAGMLIKKMYSWRGYHTTNTVEDQPNRITLVSSSGSAVIGTITIGLDSPVGLMADRLYHDEIEPMRARGRRLCEFTKLAIDESVRSKRMLAALFHIAVIYAYLIHKRSDILIEVNPRHVVFYERILKFSRLGAEKLNHRVEAPAVLLGIDLTYLNAQVELFGGKPDLAFNEKSLYPYFFSPAEANGIAHRLLRPELA
jgi:hypothetical protein